MNDLISRQAAIDALNNIEIPRNASWYQYYQQALTAVDKLPPAQLSTNLAEVGTDCISRQQAIDAIDEIESEIAEGFGFEYEKWRKYFCDLPSAQPEITHEQAVGYLQSTGWMQNHDLQMMLDGIHKFTAQPERIRGRWTRDNACSECGCQPWFSGDIHNYNFCPNCGAEMEKEVTT